MRLGQEDPEEPVKPAGQRDESRRAGGARTDARGTVQPTCRLVRRDRDETRMSQADEARFEPSRNQSWRNSKYDKSAWNARFSRLTVDHPSYFRIVAIVFNEAPAVYL